MRADAALATSKSFTTRSTVRVFDPRTGAPIQSPILSLDSYFENPVLALSVDPMLLAREQAQNATFTLSFSGRGPLADRNPDPRCSAPSNCGAG